MVALAVQPASSLGQSLSSGGASLCRLKDSSQGDPDVGQPFEDRPWAGEDEDDDTASLLSVSEIVRQAWGGSRDQSKPLPHMGQSQDTAIVIPDDDDAHDCDTESGSIEILPHGALQLETSQKPVSPSQPIDPLDMTLPEFSFGAPLEANHVSSEDTQAQLDEFRQMPWIKLGCSEEGQEILASV